MDSARGAATSFSTLRASRGRVIKSRFDSLTTGYIPPSASPCDPAPRSFLSADRASRDDPPPVTGMVSVVVATRSRRRRVHRRGARDGRPPRRAPTGRCSLTRRRCPWRIPARRFGVDAARVRRARRMGKARYDEPHAAARPGRRHTAGSRCHSDGPSMDDAVPDEAGTANGGRRLVAFAGTSIGVSCVQRQGLRGTTLRVGRGDRRRRVALSMFVLVTSMLVGGRQVAPSRSIVGGLPVLRPSRLGVGERRPVVAVLRGAQPCVGDAAGHHDFVDT